MLFAFTIKGDFGSVACFKRPYCCLQRGEVNRFLSAYVDNNVPVLQPGRFRAGTCHCAADLNAAFCGQSYLLGLLCSKGIADKDAKKRPFVYTSVQSRFQHRF